MIDFETLHLSPQAVALSMGVAVFDQNRVLHKAAIHLDAEEQLSLGRNVSVGTFLWWLQQSDEARADVVAGQTGGNAISIDNAVRWLDRTWLEFKCERVWGHGASFDIPLAEDLFVNVPWGHRQIRDTRTLFDLAQVDRVEPEVSHRAEDDAEAQALTVIRAWDALVLCEDGRCPHYGVPHVCRNPPQPEASQLQ